MRIFCFIANAASRAGRRIGPMGWVWVTVLAAVLFSGAVVWTQERQHQLLAHFSAEQALLRQARIDLAKGYLHVSLAGSPQSPFDRAQGLALLDQAGSSLERALRLQREFAAGRTIPRADEASPSLLAAFAQAVAQFRGLVVGGRGDPERDSAREAELRIAFFSLERQADAVDPQIQQDLSWMVRRYDQFNAMIFWGPGSYWRSSAERCMPEAALGNKPRMHCGRARSVFALLRPIPRRHEHDQSRRKIGADEPRVLSVPGLFVGRNG
jgi:hypothetical protein